MDAEKLSEAVSSSNCAGQPDATRSCALPCELATCRTTCSLEVVDNLLSLLTGVSAEEADHLLDLRLLLKHRKDAEASLRVFCELRRRMEQRHYLAFYRMRRWLENQIVACIRPSSEKPGLIVPLRLNFYCVEAIRRGCLCQCLGGGAYTAVPRLEFVFLAPLKTVAASPVSEPDPVPC